MHDGISAMRTRETVRTPGGGHQLCTRGAMRWNRLPGCCCSLLWNTEWAGGLGGGGGVRRAWFTLVDSRALAAPLVYESSVAAVADEISASEDWMGPRPLSGSSRWVHTVTRVDELSRADVWLDHGRCEGASALAEAVEYFRSRSDTVGGGQICPAVRRRLSPLSPLLSAFLSIPWATRICTTREPQATLGRSVLSAISGQWHGFVYARSRRRTPNCMLPHWAQALALLLVRYSPVWKSRRRESRIIIASSLPPRLGA
ncbi:hypothetical protein PYCCODRAFT_1272028 [Trametes coccinea BRFM310]|uniref:Uncharacterized protein n=1 Tax=Trametes coccinea (strain BRFM310) TaxID=1353009 RepID=A0A1Y2IV25_TRAC3|nr:hypothetical protein PYCCODRAFT_1272028 [Trametes coccinea BRFM310]